MDWLREVRALATMRLLVGLAIVGTSVFLFASGQQLPEALAVSLGAVVTLLFPQSQQHK